MAILSASNRVLDLHEFPGSKPLAGDPRVNHPIKRSGERCLRVSQALSPALTTEAKADEIQTLSAAGAVKTEGGISFSESPCVNPSCCEHTSIHREYRARSCIRIIGRVDIFLIDLPFLLSDQFFLPIVLPCFLKDVFERLILLWCPYRPTTCHSPL